MSHHYCEHFQIGPLITYCRCSHEQHSFLIYHCMSLQVTVLILRQDGYEFDLFFRVYGPWPNTVSLPSICRLIEMPSIPQAHADLDGSWFLLTDYQKQCIATRNKLQHSIASNLIVGNIPSVCIRLTANRWGLSNWDLMQRHWGENRIRGLLYIWIYSWGHC